MHREPVAHHTVREDSHVALPGKTLNFGRLGCGPLHARRVGVAGTVKVLDRILWIEVP